MKLSVTTDASGKILAFAHPARSESPSATGDSRKTRASHKAELALDPDDGQFVHEVDVPAALEPHLGRDTFADELFKHALVKKELRLR
jgi:hypothetical protein